MIRLSVILISVGFSILSLQGFSQNLTELNTKIEDAYNEGDTLELVRAYYQMGKYYDQHDRIDSSCNMMSHALLLAKCIQNDKAIASVANYLASNYSEIGACDSSIIYYKVAIHACKVLSDSSRLPTILLNLGAEYVDKGDYLKASELTLEAVRIKEIRKDSSNLTFFYQKLGEVYKEIGETDKWEEYVQKAYALIHNELCSNDKATAAIYNDLGGIAELYERFDQALLYYDTLMNFGRENNYNKAIAIALCNSAVVYRAQGDVDKALELTVEAQNYKSESDALGDISDNNQLAELYFINGNMSEASNYARLVIDAALLDNYPEERKRACKTFYQIEKKQSNFEEALMWNEKLKALSDSLRDENIRTQIIEMEMAYQTTKKEQKIEILETENQLKSQRMHVGIVLVFVLLFIIVLILYVLRIRKRHAELKQSDLKQQVLRAQMNPHFIFNVLGSIQNFMLNNDPKKAAGYLANFASLTRSTLQYSAIETISLSEEINMLRNYMELEKMRVPEKFNFKIEMDPDIEVDLIHIPPMLIQPFVENAIKHGFYHLDRTGQLTLKVSDEGDAVLFVLEDDGKGLQDKNEGEEKHQSMAMNIFTERRKLIKQRHKREFHFEIIDRHEVNPSLSGVRISVKIPILEV